MALPIPVDHDAPDPAIVAKAAAVLRGGGIVAMRTDTVYGLLASVARPEALRRLGELKGRSGDKPFVVLAADWIGVRSVAAMLPPIARRLGARFWPGPVTLVLPAEKTLPGEVTGRGTVAVRIPGDALLRSLLTEIRRPLAAPSANRAGGKPAATAAEVVELFGESVDLVLDGGPVPGGSPSTIVSCVGDYPEVLRRGGVVPTDEDLALR